MNRRDWFRLRVSPRPASEPSRLETPAGMQSVDRPDNHGGVELSELPPMHEALLSPEDVTALFSDIRTHATDIQLIARRAEQGGPALTTQLDLAAEKLLAGNISRMQVRYQWQQCRWIDTLENRPEGFRLVRIRHA